MQLILYPAYFYAISLSGDQSEVAERSVSWFDNYLLGASSSDLNIYVIINSIENLSGVSHKRNTAHATKILFRAMYIKHYCCVFILGFLCIGQMDNAQASVCVKSVRWIDAPPYAFKNENGNIQGLHVDLVKEALRRMNCYARFVEMPWVRAIYELEQGRLDILPGAALTDERKRFALFSAPTNSARNILFLSVESAKKYQINKLVDMIGTNFRLASIRNVANGDEFDTLIKKSEFSSRVTYVNSPSLGWLMMEKDRVDGQIEDELAGIYRIKQMGLEKVIKPSNLVIVHDFDFVAFSRTTTDAEFVKNFDVAFGTMIADGVYKEILARYLTCQISIKNLGCK